MPGIVAHMSVAKMIGEKIGVTDPDFYRGNLLPDILKGDKMKTHFKIQGKVFHIPDTNYFQSHFDLSNPLYLGYYTHLLLDYYFMDEFIPLITHDRDVFRSNGIYDDYDKSNRLLIDYFHLDIDQILSYLTFSDFDVDPKRLNNNLACLQISKSGNTTYFSVEDFILFLNESAARIVESIMNEKKYILTCSDYSFD